MHRTYFGYAIFWLSLLCTISLAAALSLDDPDQHIPCRKPAVSKANANKTAHMRRQEEAAVRARQSIDGIAREINCRPECDICCDGKCCEEIDATSDPDFDFNISMQQLWIPIRFVLITDQAAVIAQVNMAKINEQIGILNHAFNTIGIWFYAHSFLVVDDDPRMVTGCNTDPCYVNEETCDFYEYIMPKVRVNGERVITYILCSLNYLGEAQLPWAEPEDHRRQYVQTHYKVLGYGSEWYKPTGGGMGTTGIHEMGHYFGLLHVFEPEFKCDDASRGDYVQDTPPARFKASREQGCSDIKDTCADNLGSDPDNNWMNYGRDECSTHFTALQYERVRRVFRKYRPKLYKNSLVNGSCHFQVSSGNITVHCHCHDKTLNPLLHCRKDPNDAPPTEVSGYLYGDVTYQHDEFYDEVYDENTSNASYTAFVEKHMAEYHNAILNTNYGDGTNSTGYKALKEDDSVTLSKTSIIIISCVSGAVVISFILTVIIFSCYSCRKRRRRRKKHKSKKMKNNHALRDEDNGPDASDAENKIEQAVLADPEVNPERQCTSSSSCEGGRTRGVWVWDSSASDFELDGAPESGESVARNLAAKSNSSAQMSVTGSNSSLREKRLAFKKNPSSQRDLRSTIKQKRVNNNRHRRKDRQLMKAIGGMFGVDTMYGPQLSS